MTDAELAILSLVAEGPQHGYQIQQAIETRGVREWTAIGFSSVYYILNKLEKDGLLSSQLTPSERGPSRKVYALTKAGHGVLQTAIADLLANPHELGGGFTLGLANLHLLRPEQVRRALDAYEAELRSRVADLNRYRSEQDVTHPDRPLHVAALFDYNLHMTLAELDWLREFRQAWDAQTPLSPRQPDPFRTPLIDRKRTPPPIPTERLPRPDRDEAAAADPDRAEDDSPPGSG